MVPILKSSLGRTFGIVCVLWCVLPLAPASAVDKPGSTGVSSTPWDPARLEDASKVIYGTDNRIDVYQETDEQHRIWAASTCALIEDSLLTENSDGTYILDVRTLEVYDYPPCPGEPFANQPTAAFCTGFVVGADLVATAGHCTDGMPLENIRFVFGFQMRDAATPVTTFDSTQVYTGIEMVGHELSGEYDYAVVRVDRRITAPGVQVLDIRRAGTVPIGTHVGIIGHPVGLPTKIAFGGESVVRPNSAEGFFLTNLDTFGGNSGSPVFNAETGLVEGILVTGEIDFVFERDCFASNVIGVNEGSGEGVCKTASFMRFVPGGNGQVALDKPAYMCTDALTVSLADMDLRDSGSAEMSIETDGGDSESLTLAEQEVAGTFRGELPVQTGVATPGNEVLEVQEGQAIIARYNDAANNWGTPDVASAAAIVDCTPPLITDVALDNVGGTKAGIAFETNEGCIGAVRYGRDRADLGGEAVGDLTTSHLVTVAGLTPTTTYYFVVEAEDRAGNTTVDDNDGACYTFTTTAQHDYFAEDFSEGSFDLAKHAVMFVPDDSLSGYRACVAPVRSFCTNPLGGRKLRLDDDDYEVFPLADGKSIEFYGVVYDKFYVGSNGYITFGKGDKTYEPSLDAHFSAPRVSGCFTDLAPPNMRPDAGVWVDQTEDKVVVTYKNVPGYWYGTCNFQIELFFDGTIRVTWLGQTCPYGIAGLSAGTGAPYDFAYSDLSAYPTCSASPGVECRRGCAAARLERPYVAKEFETSAGDALVVAVAAASFALARRNIRKKSKAA